MSPLLLALAVAAGSGAGGWPSTTETAKAEACAGITAAELERAAAPSGELKTAYVVWSGRFGSFALRDGLTPTQVNARLEASRRKAEAHPDAAALQSCLADARGRDPLGVRVAK